MGELLDEILKLMEAALGAKFKTYSVGRREMSEVGASEMPLLCAYPTVTTGERSGTGNDDATFDISVRCVMDAKKRTGAGTGLGRANLETQRDLIDAIEGRSLSDLKPRADTVYGVLNANITVSGLALYVGRITIAYDSDKSPEAKGITREMATLNLTVHARPPWRG